MEKNVLEFLNEQEKEIGKYESDLFFMNMIDIIHDYKIKSPIEKLLFIALKSIQRFNYIDNFEADSPNHVYRYGLTYEPQFKIGKYTVDFKIQYHYSLNRTLMSKTIIVECDGHEFHDKNKEQRKYEKERDRFIVKQGYKIFHYTGSEIFNNPLDIAVEILSYLTGIDKDSFCKDSNII